MFAIADSCPGCDCILTLPPRALQISCIVRDMRVDAKQRVDQGVILAEDLTVNDIRDSFWDRSICPELVLHYRLDRQWSTHS